MERGDTIKIGTKVLVHAKTVGSSFEQVSSRVSDENPRELPFFGWTKGMKMNREYENVYIIAYKKGYGGGDYYHRNDFDIVGGETFTDKEFEL